MKKTVVYILYATAFISGVLGSSVPDVANWFEIAKPYYLVAIISLISAVCLTYWMQILSIIVTTILVVNAHGYDCGLIKTGFAKKSYKLYQMNYYSFLDLMLYVQGVAVRSCIQN